ncbi:MAG: trypsin-like peptidase domain-containing protein [bacterium]
MEPKNKKIDSNNACAKEKLKPWLVGLMILFIVVIGWILLGKGWKSKERAWEDRMFLGKTNLPGGIESRNKPNQVTLRNQQDSYHNIVQLVKPAIVGISLPNAQPFFQKWGVMGNQIPDLAWLRCPGCGWVTIEPPENLLTPIICPNCSTVISQNPQVQKQAWWQPTQLPQGQMQALGMRGQGFGSNTLSMLCPNCGTTVTRQPGIPWTAITCPNCGLSMFCPRLPNNFPGGQQQVWMQPTVQPPPSNIQNGPFPSPGQEAVMPGFQGLGSGVIVSQRGYILTNSHLVSGQRFVTVTLFTPQGQSSFRGQIVAQAPDRDLAIVKIDSQNIDLPVVPVSNSDTVQVGDTVLAFGNPFGLSQTVTSGIISAVRTSTVIEGHQLNDLIQTDAPINQGNSGGPLVNLRGEVIGINTAIYSPAQTHTGLGFAVPINQAKEVFGSYMDGSAQKVAMQFLGYPNPKTYLTAGQKAAPRTRVPEDAPAWLGINIQILNDVLAEQLNVPVDRGILINEVYANSPAAESGLKRGDVIIRFDGKRITDETQIRTLLAEKKPGDKVKLTILRGRRRLDIKFETAGGGWWQAQPAAIQNRSINLLKNAEIETGSAEIVSLGIAALTITPEIAFTYGLPKDARGIIATETEGLALNCGIKDGDIIKKVNNRATPDLVSFLKAIKKGDPSRGIALSLIRGGMPMDIVIKEKPELLPRGL